MMLLWPELEGVTFCEIQLPEYMQSATYNRKTIHLKAYEIIKDGKVAGYVWRRMATLERKTPGRMYVNARWRAPRWVADEKDPRHHLSGRLCDYVSRNEAADTLLRYQRRYFIGAA